MIKKKFYIALLLFSFNANAMLSKNCRNEIHKTCDDKAINEIKNCIDSNINNFSESCKEELNLLSFCKNEVKKLCNLSHPAENKKEIIDCITKNIKKLPIKCKKVFNEMRKRNYGIIKVCKNDIDVFCKDSNNRREIFSCLSKNKEEISKICKAKIENIEKQKMIQLKNR